MENGDSTWFSAVLRSRMHPAAALLAVPIAPQQDDVPNPLLPAPASTDTANSSPRAALYPSDPPWPTSDRAQRRPPATDNEPRTTHKQGSRRTRCDGCRCLGSGYRAACLTARTPRSTPGSAAPSPRCPSSPPARSPRCPGPASRDRCTGCPTEAGSPTPRSSRTSGPP